jgi:ribosome-binding protein aMBF1 (putative translation factor)
VNLYEELLRSPTDPVSRLASANANADIALILALRNARREAGLSHEDVAMKLGVTADAVREVESLSAEHNLSTLRRYALAIGVRVTHHVERA